MCYLPGMANREVLDQIERGYIQASQAQRLSRPTVRHHEAVLGQGPNEQTDFRLSDRLFG